MYIEVILTLTFFFFYFHLFYQLPSTIRLPTYCSPLPPTYLPACPYCIPTASSRHPEELPGAPECTQQCSSRTQCGWRRAGGGFQRYTWRTGCSSQWVQQRVPRIDGLWYGYGQDCTGKFRNASGWNVTCHESGWDHGPVFAIYIKTFILK